MTAILFPQDNAYLKKNIKPILSDLQIVRIPPGPKGARVPKYFAQFPEWEAKFEILITDDSMPEETIKDSIVAAGIYNGLLDGRPDYGRFVMNEFKKNI